MIRAPQNRSCIQNSSLSFEGGLTLSSSVTVADDLPCDMLLGNDVIDRIPDNGQDQHQSVFTSECQRLNHLHDLQCNKVNLMSTHETVLAPNSFTMVSGYVASNQQILPAVITPCCIMDTDL